jgi:hypothetical protein
MNFSPRFSILVSQRLLPSCIINLTPKALPLQSQQIILTQLSPRHRTIRWLDALTQPILLIEADVLGDAAVVAMAIADVVVADVDADVATTTTLTRRHPMLPDSILRRNGTNFLLKSVIRSGKSATRKANLAEPSES